MQRETDWQANEIRAISERGRLPEERLIERKRERERERQTDRDRDRDREGFV